MFANNLLQLQTTDGSELFEIPLVCVNQTQLHVWDSMRYANVGRKAFLYSHTCISGMEGAYGYNNP
jgi:hypothetical protein